ncbi:hypothetical protein GCM10028832_01810 [Streptomyces sparsus]
MAFSRPLAAPLAHERTTPASLVFTVSYEKPDGGHGGLAVAVDHADATAVSYARRQVESWRDVLRTRRVLYVLAAGEQAGAGPRHSLPVLVPAQHSGGARSPHNVCGCPRNVVCPSAEYAQRALRRFLDRGDEVLVVGTPLDSAAVRDDMDARGRVIRVDTSGPAATVQVADSERLSFVVAPGAVMAQVTDILTVLRSRFPRLRGQHPGEWCYAMDNLNTAVVSALNQSDVLLVTGSESCAIARTGVAEAAKAGLPVRSIPSLAHLRPEDVDVSTITVLDTDGQTRALQQLGQVLGGLGPISHIRRRVHSDDVSLTLAPPTSGGATPDDRRQTGPGGGRKPSETTPD